MTDTRDVFLCDGVRTPIGRYGGALAKVRTDDLAAVPIRALVKRHPEVDWSALDEVVLGCANQAGEDNRNVARMALLLAGLPDSVPGVTVNRLCASGLSAVVSACHAISAGDGDNQVTAARVAMAIATYERTLVADQTAWDRWKAGETSAMTSNQIAGWNDFNSRLCVECHAPPLQPSHPIRRPKSSRQSPRRRARSRLSPSFPTASLNYRFRKHSA